MLTRTRLRLAGLAVCLAFAAPARAADRPPLETVAEKSGYRTTSRHAEVVAFCEELAKRSPLVRLGQLGVSGEGRKLPLVILADPPVATPEEAAKGGKPVAFVIGNIHAGEVDGKEAILALARDLAVAKERPLLKDLVLVFAPIFNADGNERIDKAHRTEQVGPADGVGIRENAAGLDLNRDFVKLETPEVRALVKALNRWDAALFIDCHTTNGSHHRYPLTYDGPRHPSSPAGLVELVRDRLLPDAGRRLEKGTGFPSFFYGNFERDHTVWAMYPAEPRYSVPYVGLCGRVGVLSESYSYASYRDRVRASYGFVLGCLETTVAHKDEIRKVRKEGKPPEKLALRTKSASLGERKVLGFVEVRKDGRTVATDRPREYTLDFLGKVEPTLTVLRPHAYLFPADYSRVVEVLQRHGVTVEELREDVELDVEVYRVDKVTRAAQAFQNHRLVVADATARKATRRVPAGTVLVRTGQKLGTLAALMLEPQCEDGLTTWNFFDAGLAAGKDFPVLRLPAEAPLNAGAVRPLAEERTLNKPFTPDLLLGKATPPNLSGSPAAVTAWLDDGEHFLQVKGGVLCKVHARTGRAAPFLDRDRLVKSLQALAALDADAVQALARSLAAGPGPRHGGAGGAQMNPQRTGVLFGHGDDLYFTRFDGSPAVRLTRSPGAKELPSFSPDGNFVAFVRGGNLHVVDLATQTEKGLTTDGGGKVSNGKADWVYFEEVYNRNYHAYWWAPDSKHLAFLRFDDTPVRPFTVVNELPVRQKVEVTPYPKAGDPNPMVGLGVVPVGGGEAAFADLGGYSPTASLVMRVGWTPDGRLYFYVQDRAQTWLDVCTCGAGGEAVTRLFRETTKAWVDDPGEPTFLKDGSFILASERTGWRHLYHFDKAGKLLRPLTGGGWEARTLHLADQKNGWLYVSGTKDDPVGGDLYRCKLDGTGLERLTQGSGTHTVSVSPTGSLFVDSWTDFTTPTRVRLHDASGAPLRAVDTNPVYAREEYRFGAFDHVQIPLPDGFVLEGTVLKPPDFDPTRRYPVWLVTYGGPHAPTVHDGWDGGRVYEQVLAGMGFVVFRTDPRSASGKGACSTWTAYRRLGVQELKDLEGAVDWLCRNSWADAKRVGLAGGSYGGFLTAFALTHSKHFASGVASAPVTDWHDYDSVYTERYMNTPQENPEGYAATSVVKAAKNLHGKLLLHHGVMDDNVHIQNALQFMDALQKADKEFEVMFYPLARHGGFGRHAQRQSLEFIRRTLGGPEPPAKAAAGAGGAAAGGRR